MYKVIRGLFDWVPHGPLTLGFLLGNLRWCAILVSSETIFALDEYNILKCECNYWRCSIITTSIMIIAQWCLVSLNVTDYIRVRDRKQVHHTTVSKYQYNFYHDVDQSYSDLLQFKLYDADECIDTVEADRNIIVI